MSPLPRSIPKRGAHQGGLAGPVRADDHMDPDPDAGEAEIPQQGLLAEGGRESGYFKHVYALPRINQMKKGTPMSAVTMPMGNRAPGMMDLDSTEAADSMQARTGADRGSKR